MGPLQLLTPTEKFERIGTAEAGTFHKVENQAKENLSTLSYGHHTSSQVNLGGFKLFCESSSGGSNNLPTWNKREKL